MFLPQKKADQSHRQPSHFVKEGRTEEGGGWVGSLELFTDQKSK